MNTLQVQPVTGYGSRVTRISSRGQVATEFMLTLPIAMAFIVAVAAIAAMGLRGVAAERAAQRAARVAAVFQEGFVQAEADRALSPTLFRGGAAAIADASGGTRSSNADEGVLSLGARSNAALGSASRGFGASWRRAPIVPALPPGLGRRVLQAGDTPSPYCPDAGGYGTCGYPQ